LGVPRPHRPNPPSQLSRPIRPRLERRPPLEMLDAWNAAHRVAAIPFAGGSRARPTAPKCSNRRQSGYQPRTRDPLRAYVPTQTEQFHRSQLPKQRLPPHRGVPKRRQEANLTQTEAVPRPLTRSRPKKISEPLRRAPISGRVGGRVPTDTPPAVVGPTPGHQTPPTRGSARRARWLTPDAVYGRALGTRTRLFSHDHDQHPRFRGAMLGPSAPR
jgi:hypothetical protein